MKVDIEYLRRQYDSLSDEALQDIDRSELVEAAQKCYDEEIARRGLNTPRASRAHVRSEPVVEDDAQSVEEPEAPNYSVDDNGEKPEWLDEAAQVFSSAVFSQSAVVPEAHSAQDALKEAGIPCYLELVEIPEEKEPEGLRVTHEWRLMVPGDLNMEATSILDRDLYNDQFEAEWRSHLETVSDNDLRRMSPEKVFCGLFDRVERVTRVYDQELAQRGLKP